MQVGCGQGCGWDVAGALVYSQVPLAAALQSMVLGEPQPLLCFLKELRPAFRKGVRLYLLP